MLDNIRQWHRENHYAITWFLIGTFTAFGFADISRGDWGWAIIDFGLAYINFAFRNDR